MKKFIFISVSFLFTINSYADLPEIANKKPVAFDTQRPVRTTPLSTSNKKCSVDSDKLQLLKSFATCMNGKLLMGCGALGGYAAGRAISQKLKNAMVEDLQKNKTRILNNLILDAYEADRADQILTKPLDEIRNLRNDLELYSADPKEYKDLIKDTQDRITAIQNAMEKNKGTLKKVYEPRIVQLPDGKFVDVMNLQNIDDIVKHSSYTKEYETLFNAYVDQVRSGNRSMEAFAELRKSFVKKIVDEEVAGYEKLLRQSKTGLSKETVDEFIKKKVTQHAAAITDQMNDSVSKLLKEVIVSDNGALAERMALAEKQMLKARVASTVAGATIGGVVGTVGDLVFAMTPSDAIGCSTLTAKYTNATKKDCSMGSPEFSPAVEEFLDLPAEQRTGLLQDPNVCLFYDELYKNSFSQGIEDVTCMGNSIRVSMNAGYLGKYDKMITLRDDKTVQAIDSSFPSGGTVHYQVDEKGKDVKLKLTDKNQGRDLSLAKKAVEADRLYASEVVSCCNLEGSAHDACLKALNKNSTAHVFKPASTKTNN